MELTINRKCILDALQKIHGSVKKYVSISANKKVEFSACNDSTTSLSIQDCEVKKDGQVIVDFSKLLNFAKNYHGEDILLKKTSAGWLSISGENIKIKLPGIQEESICLIKFDEMKNSISINNEEIKNAISLTEFAIGQSISREGLLGLNIKSDGNIVSFCAADGHMSARYQINHKCEEFDILIPKKSTSEICKIIDEKSMLKYNDSKIQIESDVSRFKSGLLGAKFPNISNMFSEKKNKIKINRELLLNFLNILSMSAGSETIVKFVFSKNKINLETQKLDTGDYEASIECEYSGEDLSVGFNTEIMKKSLTGFNILKDEFIYINIDNPEWSVVLTSDSMPNYKTFFMPVRIKW